MNEALTTQANESREETRKAPREWFLCFADTPPTAFTTRGNCKCEECVVVREVMPNEGNSNEEEVNTPNDWLCYYAGQALIGLMREGDVHKTYYGSIATASFDIAEAMMKERKLREGKE